MSTIPQALQRLITQLKKLPGVGTKTAERYAFELLKWEPSSLQLLSTTLEGLPRDVRYCTECFCLQGEDHCHFCDTNKRDGCSLCIVAQAKDIYPIEETRLFKGLYHVLGTLISPMQGDLADRIDFKKLRERIDKHQVQDVILALDATLEGDATALFLREEMESWNVSISRLAFGIPLGSSFDYVDTGTLARALVGRQRF